MNRPTMRMRSDPPWTLAEFHELLQEMPEGERWELMGGRIYKMMVGGTIGHGRIVGNVGFALSRQLRERGSPCSVFQEAARVEIEAAEASFFPDVVVTCQDVDPAARAVRNPVVLVEVLSRTTRDKDETVKLAVYRTIPSLRAYIMVEQGVPGIRAVLRAEGDRWDWVHLEVGGLTSVHVPEIDLTLTLAETYAGLLELVAPS
ncbi:Uma2 family endonuclease [Chthonobacter rhizosphaerae]|uniref:Uma2 family endonuclease n=1 Tax=Chthonobacter rhizosphaerae TaxID=2735553 RepID=UPI0015EF9B33|nr:Uma2 family endonuclease [Chthonobacter rhizosphaerae]